MIRSVTINCDSVNAMLIFDSLLTRDSKALHMLLCEVFPDSEYTVTFKNDDSLNKMLLNSVLYI